MAATVTAEAGQRQPQHALVTPPDKYYTASTALTAGGGGVGGGEGEGSMTDRRGSMTGGEGRVNTGCVASVRTGKQAPCSHG